MTSECMGAHCLACPAVRSGHPASTAGQASSGTLLLRPIASDDFQLVLFAFFGSFEVGRAATRFERDKCAENEAKQNKKPGHEGPFCILVGN